MLGHWGAELGGFHEGELKNEHDLGGRTKAEIFMLILQGLIL